MRRRAWRWFRYWIEPLLLLAIGIFLCWEFAAIIPQYLASQPTPTPHATASSVP